LIEPMSTEVYHSDQKFLESYDIDQFHEKALFSLDYRCGSALPYQFQPLWQVSLL
jgi:hypothetical protein